MAVVSFPVMLLGNHYLLDRSWWSSLFGAVVFEFLFIPSMYFFLRWWRKKAYEQHKPGD